MYNRGIEANNTTRRHEGRSLLNYAKQITKGGVLSRLGSTVRKSTNGINGLSQR